MNLAQALMRSSRGAWPELSWEQYLSWFQFDGLNYPLGLHQTLTGDRESIAEDFEGFAQHLYRGNGVVFAVMGVRLLLFSEARFAFRGFGEDGRPGELFRTPALGVLDKPWSNGTTGDLLARTIQDGDLAGNFYGALRGGRRGQRIRRMRPDWTTIVLGSPDEPSTDPSDLDAEVVGFAYQPGGPGSGNDPIALLPEEVVHFAPTPDPLANYRGMSWLTPVLREVAADTAATRHKLKFFEQGATPNMVVKLDAGIDAKAFEKWVELMEEKHAGLANAYRTLYLGGGADATVVGSDFKQLDFKVTQGAGETRIAAAGGVPPVIVGLSEGLQAATYSNYGQARRRLADGTMRPLWRNAAGSFATVIEVPAQSELWYDDRDIPFLQEDQKDAAEIQAQEARTIRQLVDAGFTPESVVGAVRSGDFSRLEHTGLFSVQLQPPGTQTDPSDAGRALAELIAPYLKRPPNEED